ncbi:MAG TPA: PTS mannitol transporter subunit IICB [Microbacterium sp.]|uniref:PTS mannitol transporter subunit IICB n=1 Tax=Microbacterium sp. TaxID=51671 RepID=UPI002B45AB0B|nr:PTS mannitol transporter subunit IICB [Microbacterium sp.]HKT58203.1 PTS mannitol transporter subunit IICB [Microbacterium sp.]
MTTTSPPAAMSGGKKAQVHIQRFGTFLSGMIMPNIAAFIAWGLITSLFIAVGWLGWWHPVADLLGGFGNANQVGWAHAMTTLALAPDGKTTFPQYVGLVGSMITYLLPLLIANTGGRMVYGERGGVVASIATMGVIVGTTIPMFLGAMIMGPFAALVTKWMDRIWDGKIRPGFEMLVNNFSAGILGMLLAVLGFFAFGPVFTYVAEGLGAAVQWLVSLGLLPLLSIIVEPAKILFLNNAINHGVFTPLGIEQAAHAGKSILFLIEANPGPGVGVLLAFSFFGVGVARSSAPGAIIIQFFGGIHEIYFPYVLMKPILFLSVIAGGITGVATNAILGGGLRFPAAPGSIIAVILAAAPAGAGNLLVVLLSVVLAATVSFLLSSLFLLRSRKRDLAAGGGDLQAAIAQTEANKGKESAALSGLRQRTAGGTAETAGASTANTAVAEKRVDHIVFACDAGMGSSAMGASVLRNKIKKAGVEGVTVVNKAIANLDGTADLIITQNQLTDRARAKAPDAIHVSVDNFMNSPRYDEVVDLVREQHQDGQ